jgi:hypothetical protein
MTLIQQGFNVWQELIHIAIQKWSASLSRCWQPVKTQSKWTQLQIWYLLLLLLLISALLPLLSKTNVILLKGGTLNAHHGETDQPVLKYAVLQGVLFGQT